jgi:hypothetical protein
MRILGRLGVQLTFCVSTVVFSFRFGGFDNKAKDAAFDQKVFKGIVAARKTREIAENIHAAVTAAARQAAGKDEYSCLHVR